MSAGCAKADDLVDESLVESKVEVVTEVTEAAEIIETAEEATKTEAIQEVESNEVAEDKEMEEKATEEVVVETPVVVDYADLGVNEVGHIMVVMYHGIKDNPPYHITKEAFKADLDYLYEHNYRLISVRDFLDQTIDIEAGMTPIVFTFDDGLPSTFSLIEVEGELQVNPDTAIGIIEEFAEEHPDFGREAALYFHATTANFKGAGTEEERLQWLLDHGYEFGNHSATHANFSQLSAEGLLKEVGSVDEFIIEQGFDYKMRSLTYPFGARPDSSLTHLLYEGSYKGIDLAYEVAFREGPSSSHYAPSDVKFSPYNAPRVRGSQGEVQDMWWFLEFYEDNRHQLYVSDGDPTTIVVPSDYEERVDIKRFPDLELITYDQE